MTTFRLVGPGRAGSSLAAALVDAGCELAGGLGRGDDLGPAASGVDAVVIATPDAAVAEVAAAIDPVPETVVLHLSGALGLDVLAPHHRRGSLHPLMPLPDAETGRARLSSGIAFAVAGDALVTDLVVRLGGRPLAVADDLRAAYHAAACIAANHLVGLLGQVERVAATAGLPLEVFLPLAGAALADTARRGPAAALTGPAARGDEATLDRHRHVLDPAERDGYEAGVRLVRRVAGQGAADTAEMARCG